MEYWLKGVCVSTAVFILVTILFFSFDHKDGTFFDWLVILPLMPFAFAALFTGEKVFTGFLLQYLIYFTAGAFFGWLCGKMKQKGQRGSRL